MSERKCLSVRQAALDRHALTRRLERREKWLERAGITPALFKRAVDTLIEALGATKVVERGPRAGEEIPDVPARVRAAGEITELVRLTVGLTAETQQAPGAPAQVALVINIPDWLKAPPPPAPALSDGKRQHQEGFSEVTTFHGRQRSLRHIYQQPRQPSNPVCGGKKPRSSRPHSPKRKFENLSR